MPTTYLDPNLARWVTSALSKTLQPIVVDDLEITFWTEGIDFEERTLFQTDNAVLRVTGPKYVAGSGEDWNQFEVLVLLTDLFSTTKDAYAQMRQGGIIANTLSQPIPVYRTGTGPDDDQSLVGCLTVDRTSRDFVRQVNYGILDKDTRVKQAGVIARYEITT